MRNVSRHTEWLGMVETSGPFLAVSVLERIFPQGLDVIETPRRIRLRMAYDEWCEAVDDDDRMLKELHREWVSLVYSEILEYDDTILIPNEGDESLVYNSPEHMGTFSPEFILRNGINDKPLLLVSIQPPGVDLEKIPSGDGWPASLVERMTLLCRSASVRLGLLTNGERWMLVNAPVGATSSHTSWYSRLWFQEPVTLKAFQSLFGVRRFFGPTEETLDALLEESLEHQEEVTDTLGEQVRRAVEVLVQCLDKADLDRNRELLLDVPSTELYEAGLTVMMRLVFVLCAEERELLLLGDPTYDQCYAISTLRGQLTEEANLHGPEVLERRHDAWSRLLAVFRVIYGGVEQESLRMPAMGGSLFDPDRFPFLEGRRKGTRWCETFATPLPIDNRTVLLLLNALQVLEQKGGALLLSYKALDVEQIGHVYEGLLEHTVKRMPRVTLGLEGSQKARNPNLALSEMESARLDETSVLVKTIMEATQRSESAIENALDKEVDESTFSRVLSVCGGDTELAQRIRPFAHLLKEDAWGDFIVYRENAFAVTLGVDRRETGTHYTPKSLTENIVETTLEPIVYVGPSEGKPRDRWKLRSSAELLDLKICDPAMGSGAFLVQVCRLLAERLVESWGNEETAGKYVTVDGEVKESPDGFDPMPVQLNDRLLVARRLVAEKCIYGVDINPLAVELAKLSIWLVTLAKGRPFGFLDHTLRSGDSLLGLYKLEQLYCFDLHADDKTPKKLFAQKIDKQIKDALVLRKQLRAIPIRDIRDVQYMERLDRQTRQKLEHIEHIADAMIGEALASGGNERALETAMDNLSIWATAYIEGDNETGRKIIAVARESLSIELPAGKPPRKPFHWALEFPEVFERGGFDGVVGNPPFIFGKNITAKFGKIYNDYLKVENPDASNNVDLCAHFFVRAYNLLRKDSTFGLLATSSIAEGDTRDAGLDRIAKDDSSIYSAKSKTMWPGKAAVYVSIVNIHKGQWKGKSELDGQFVDFISPMLTAQSDWAVNKLRQNQSIAYVGVIPNGDGLFLDDEEYSMLVSEDPKNSDVLLPYITGSDLNSSNKLKGRHIINFWDWDLEKARRYSRVFEIVEQRVKPHRQTLSATKQKIKDKWWIFEASSKALFHALGNSDRFKKKPIGSKGALDKAIAIARISKTGAFTIVPADCVFAAEVVVIASDDFAVFSTLQSSVHLAFAWNYAGKMKVDLRYSPTMCFEPFPFPQLSNELREIGKKYFELRTSLLDSREVGLTKLYNEFHKETNNNIDLVCLRKAHVEMDYAVSSAYGWSDIPLDHDFHKVTYLPENDRIRFTFSEEAHREVLQRLLKLNHERYEEEVKQGLHDKKKAKTSPTTFHKKNVETSSSGQLSLFQE